MCAATSGLGNFHDIVLCFHLCASMTIALTDFKFFVFVAVVLLGGFCCYYCFLLSRMWLSVCLSVLRTNGRSGWKPLN